jgi:nitronate monooxygenase
MSVSTRLTQLLRIKHPILLAPMDLVSDGRLAAAVTRAGGFGMIGGGYGDEKWLASEMDAAGDARVGIGFITWSMAKRPRLPLCFLSETSGHMLKKSIAQRLS